MAEELELSDYSTIKEYDQVKRTGTTGCEPDKPERRLLRKGILILGILCILQATLNISLRLAFYSKEEVDQFPFNISANADLCQSELLQQNMSRFCSCCNNLLRRLMRENQALERERDLLQDKISQLNRCVSEEDDGSQGSGSGQQSFYSTLGITD